MITCYICKRNPEDNNDFFFDIITTPNGKDEDVEGRIDKEICISCVNNWIILNDWQKINLIRRITNPVKGQG